MKLLNAATTIGFFTILCRLTGFLRESALNIIVGPSIFTDALIIALRMANTFRKIFAEGAFNFVFLPKLAKTLELEGQEKANSLISQCFTLLTISLLSLIVIIEIFYPEFLMVLASGLINNHEKFLLTVELGRICFPFILLITIVALLSSVLNVVYKFALPAFIHSILNILEIITLLICFLLCASKYTMVLSLSYIVIAAGLIEIAVLLRSIKQYKFSVNFIPNCLTPDTKDILKKMVPGIIGAGVWQINILLDMWMATFLSTGSITYLNLAERIIQLPLGTIGIALSTALLPRCSKLIAKNQYEDLNTELEQSIFLAITLVIPCIIIFTSLSLQIVETFFVFGAFSTTDAFITHQTLNCFAFGLPFYVLTKIFANIFYANGNTSTPVKIASYTIFLNIVILAFLVPFYGTSGIAISNSISAFFYSCFLIKKSRKYFIITLSTNFKKQLLFHAILWTILIISINYLQQLLWNNTTTLNRFITLFSILGISGIIYYILGIIYLRFNGNKSYILWELK